MWAHIRIFFANAQTIEVVDRKRRRTSINCQFTWDINDINPIDEAVLGIDGRHEDAHRAECLAKHFCEKINYKLKHACFLLFKGTDLRN